MPSKNSNIRKHSDQAVLVSGDKPAVRFIKLPSVKAHSTLSTSEIYRRIASGAFPKQIMLGPKSAVWLESEVLNWCEEQIAVSRKGDSQ